MKKFPVNYFSPELRELIEADEYLVRVQTSLARKRSEWDKCGFGNAAYVAGSIRARIVELRKAYTQEMIRLSKNVPIVQSATGVSNIGYSEFLRVAIRIDIFKADNPAKLWRYFGYGLSRNKIPDRLMAITSVTEGTHNGKARKALSVITIRLMRAGSPYRREYDAYVARHLSAGVHLAKAIPRGRRYITKLWLKHLWRVWRRLEGLPYDNHHPDDKTIFASDFGWL